MTMLISIVTGHADRSLVLSFHGVPEFAGVYCLSYDFPMYDDFNASERWTGKRVHCSYQALIVAIATRHADAIDVKFDVDGRGVWLALPHPAWVEYNRRSGKVITDPMAVQIAGRYLKQLIENGEETGRDMYTMTEQEVLEQLEAVLQEHSAKVPA